MSVNVTHGYAPNKITTKEANAVATWVLLALDGTGYASAALLRASGKRAWPGLDAGGFLQKFSIENEGLNQAAGSAFYVCLNKGDTPTDANGTLVPGGAFTYDGPVFAVWVRKTVATDQINLVGSY